MFGECPLAIATERSAPPSASAGAELRPVEDLVAQDFDPEGDPPEENPDDAPNAVDGDPGTSWSTSTYQQQLGPGGLKSGVGLLVDLGSSREVGVLELDLAGEGTTFAAYLTDEVKKWGAIVKAANVKPE